MIVHPIQHRTGRLPLRGLPGISGDRLAHALGRHLDDAHHYFRRVQAGGQPPIDAILVGPGGTWTITHAHVAGRFRKRNGHWYRWNRSTESWIPWDATPLHQARLAGHRLELYLERATLPAMVHATLLAEHHAEIDWETDQAPGVYVYNELERLAARVSRDEELTPAQIDRIVALLDPRQPLPRFAASESSG
jgi:Nuclease-related domain